MVGRWAMALLLVPALAFADAGRLAFTTMPDGMTGVTFPSSVLRDDEVRRQLTSGLTSTFVVAATTADRVKTAARIEVRYDLWDENYLVRKVDADGARSALTLRSFDELERWWRTTPVRLLRASHSTRVDVEIVVLPFSAAESRDAREWLAKGAGVTQPAGSSAAGAPGSRLPNEEKGPPQGPSVVDAVIGTSLQAKPLITFRWRTELTIQGSR